MKFGKEFFCCVVVANSSSNNISVWIFKIFVMSLRQQVAPPFCMLLTRIKSMWKTKQLKKVVKKRRNYYTKLCKFNLVTGLIVHIVFNLCFIWNIKEEVCKFSISKWVLCKFPKTMKITLFISLLNFLYSVKCLSSHTLTS